MKRNPIQRRTPLTASKGFSAGGKPMNRVSAKKKAYRRSDEGKEAREYMGKVAKLPCVICGTPGQSEVHHVICDRFGTSRASDFDVISLCVYCHRIGPEAIHENKKAWRERNGPDHGFISMVRKLVEDMY